MWRPGPRPAPLGRPGHISGVPSRPKHPAQPLALDVGSPRAALVAGKGYFFASVRGSPHPTGPAYLHDPCASKTISARLPPARFANGRGGRPVARRRAARPTGPPMARSCGSVRKSPRASPEPRLGPPAGQLRAAAGEVADGLQAPDRAGICRPLHRHIIRRVSPSPTLLSEPATACVRPARPTPPRFSLARIASPASAQCIVGDQLY